MRIRVLKKKANGAVSRHLGKVDERKFISTHKNVFLSCCHLHERSTILSFHFIYLSLSLRLRDINRCVLKTRLGVCVCLL
jgi:hypothetical protein